MYYNYGKLLGRMREKGFTQAMLAREIGRNEATLSAKLCGQSYFTQREIDAICNIGGVEIIEANAGLWSVRGESSVKYTLYTYSDGQWLTYPDGTSINQVFDFAQADWPPTELVKNSVYRVAVPTSPVMYVVCTTVGDPPTPFVYELGEFYSALVPGFVVNYHLVNALPTDNIEMDIPNEITNIYIVKSTGIGYIYDDGEWETMADSSGLTSVKGNDKGWTDTVPTINSGDGIYTYMPTGIELYNVDANGTAKKYVLAE